MAGEIDVKRLAMALAEENSKRQTFERGRLPTGRDAGRNSQASSGSDARAAQHYNDLLRERAKAMKEIEASSAGILEAQKKLTVEEAAHQRSTEAVREMQQKVEKTAKALVKTEREHRKASKQTSEAAKAHADALKEQVERGKQVLADQKRQRNEMMKAGKQAKKNYNDARVENAKLTQQQFAARQKLGSNRAMSRELRNLRPGAESSTANIMAGQQGFSRQMLDTFRSFKNQQREAMQDKLIRGTPPPSRTSMAQNAVGANMGGGGGGAGANILAGFAKGGWGGAAVAAAKEGVSAVANAALYADDKLLKLAANHIKYTNQIPDSTGEALVSLKEFEHGFKDAYTTTISQTKGMGVGFQESYDRLAQMDRAFRPIGEDMAGTLSKLTTDSFKFAAAMGQSSENIASAMDADFRQFGSSAAKVSEDMAAVYEGITAANSAFAKDLGESIIRMDEFSDIVFESARRADLWSMNYGEVTKLLSSVATQATKAGVAEEKRQLMAKAVTGHAMGHNDAYLNIKAGEKILQKYEGVGGGTDLEAIREALKSVGVDKQQAAGLSIALKELRSGGNKAMAAELAAKSSGANGMEEQLRALQEDFLDRATEPAGRRKLLGKKLNVDDVMAALIDESLKSNDLKTAMEHLRGAGPVEGQADAAFQAKVEKGGLGKIEFASRGIITSFDNLKDSLAELTKVTIGAGHAIDLMASTFGDKDAKKRLANREAAKAKTVAMQSAEMQQASSSVQSLYSDSALSPVQKIQSSEPVDMHKFMQDQRGRLRKDSDKIRDLQQRSGGTISGDAATQAISAYNAEQDQKAADIIASDIPKEAKRVELQKLGIPHKIIRDLLNINRPVGKGGISAVMRETRGQPMPSPESAASFSELQGNMSSIADGAMSQAPPTIEIDGKAASFDGKTGKILVEMEATVKNLVSPQDAIMSYANAAPTVQGVGPK